MSVKMIACVKQVLDPETPLSASKVDRAAEGALQPLGADPGGCAGEAVAHGGSKVFLVQHALLDGVHVEPHVVALEQLCRLVWPSVLLLATNRL